MTGVQTCALPISRKALRVTENVRKVLSMELLGAAQGIDLLRPLHSTAAIERIHGLVRRHAAYADADRSYHEDLGRLECFLESPELRAAVGDALAGTPTKSGRKKRSRR